MSNHGGSYLLNSVLHELDQEGFYDYLGKEKTLAFIKKIIHIGYEEDCNNREILEDIGIKLGICYSCLGALDSDENDDYPDLCKDCQ